MTAEDIEIEGEFAVTVTDNNYRHFLGARVSEQSNSISQTFSTVTQGYYWGFGNNSESSSYSGTLPPFQVYMWYHIIQNKDYYKINEYTLPYKSGYDTNFTTPLEMVFLGRNNNGTKTATLKARVKYAIIRKAGVVIRHYIPVLDNNGVACWYDKVNDELKYSDNNVAFTHYRLIDTRDTNYGRLRELLIGYKPTPSENRAPIYLEYINQSGATGASAKIVYTDYYVSGATEFEATININSTQATTISNLFGNDAGKLKLSYDATNQAIQLVVNDYTSSWISFTPDVKHTIKYIKETDGAYTNAIYIDGTRVEQATVTSWNTTGIAEDALHILGVGSDVANHNLYNFKVWYNDGTNKFLRRNYIPVIDFNDVVCLYETEYEEHLYANGTSGTITASTNQYTQVEYTEWTGNTGVATEFSNPRDGTNNYGLPLKFRLDLMFDMTTPSSTKDMGGFQIYCNSRIYGSSNTTLRRIYMGYGGSSVDLPYTKNYVSYFFNNASSNVNRIYVDGVQKSTGSVSNSSVGYGTWYINFPSGNYCFLGKYYSYKITDYTHDVVYDYRPCKNQSDVAGMYNIYSGKFLNCSASASAGPEKFIPATQDFIFKKTDDNLYIDTGYEVYYPELKVRVKNFYNNNNINLGSYVSGGSGRFQIYNDTLGVGGGYISKYLSNSLPTDVILDGENGKVIVNNEEQTGTFSAVASIASPYIFLSHNNPLTVGQKSYLMCAELKSNGSTIRKLVPSFNPNNTNKVGVYDYVHDEYLEASDATSSKFEPSGTPQTPRSVRRIQPYYCTLNYLRSTGGQYIDTGIQGSNLLTVELKLTKATNTDIMYSGVWNSANSSNARYATYWNANNQSVYYYYGAYSTYNIVTTNIGKASGDVTLTMKPRALDVDGVEVWSSSDTQTFTTTYNFHLFAVKKDGNAPTNLGTYNIRGCKMWLDNVIVRDYIPVLDWNMRPALYDLVNETFNYNIGTGEFLYG